MKSLRDSFVKASRESNLLAKSLFEELKVPSSDVQRLSVDVIWSNLFERLRHSFQVFEHIRTSTGGREHRGEDHAHVQTGSPCATKDLQSGRRGRDQRLDIPREIRIHSCNRDLKSHLLWVAGQQLQVLRNKKGPGLQT